MAGRLTDAAARKAAEGAARGGPPAAGAPLRGLLIGPAMLGTMDDVATATAAGGVLAPRRGHLAAASAAAAPLGAGMGRELCAAPPTTVPAESTTSIGFVVSHPR